MTFEIVSEVRSFDGVQGVYRHEARATACSMRFAVFLPPLARRQRVPALYWLSGLTCTEENFIAKAGAQRVAAELGIALVVPDTSPRGITLPGDREAYDFGLGAGFYLDATQAPWSAHYRMRTYVGTELPALVATAFPIDPARVGIFGHSMGGHGALTLGLRHPDRFRTVSAFAPIASTMRCPWGVKALTGYLGADVAAWHGDDATSVIAEHGWRGPALLVDQGAADPFLATQLRPDLLQAACRESGVPLELRVHKGYDHSYYFIASFIEHHLRYHASLL
jgi:S-formylglutathione hydrolase